MPDMSHAAVQARLQAAFDAALAVPTYSSQDDRWRLYVDGDLHSLIGADEALGAVDLAPRFADLMRLKFPRSRWSSAGVVARHWEGAGNLIHWALRYDLATQEAGPDGAPRWRVVRPEATYVVDPKQGWRVVQVRGLPPALQSAQHKREAARMKLHATLDRKARDAADAEIRRIVAAMQAIDRDVLFEGESLRRNVPEICYGRRLAEVSPILIETHHRLGMKRSEIKSWIRALSIELQVLQHRHAQPNLRWRVPEPPPPPGPAEIPDEDEAALGALA